MARAPGAIEPDGLRRRAGSVRIEAQRPSLLSRSPDAGGIAGGIAGGHCDARCLAWHDSPFSRWHGEAGALCFEPPMLRNGYLRVGRLARVELRLHWSMPVAALLFASLRFEPLLWLGFAGVVIVHQLGHAVLVSSMGHSLEGVDLTGIGGQCRWRGQASALDEAWIAWGGVLAQSLLLLGTLILAWGAPESRWGGLIRHAWVDINLWIIALNLLPVGPFDGASAWALFGELKRAGWTPGRGLLYPAWRWAQLRRRRRRADANVSPASSRDQPASTRASRLAEPPDEPVSAPPVEDDGVLVKPSAQAQRELAALLERIAEDAGKTKRRRD